MKTTPVPRGRNQSGFTLIELVVAIAIFSVMGVMAWAGMMSMVQQKEMTEERMERFREVQQGITLMVRDLEHIRPRPIRGASHGDMQPAVRGGGFVDIQLEFTRGGVTNPLEQQRPDMQRVGYQLDGEQLLRYSWPVLDRAPETEPLTMPLIEDVNSLVVSYLDMSGEWHEQWPPATGSGSGESGQPPGMEGDNPYLMPLGIEIMVDVDGVGEIRRLVDVPTLTPGAAGAEERE